MHKRSHRLLALPAQGFSLLELAVVIGIIALVAGAGMTMATGALKAADRITTQERLNTVKLALDSFVKTYGYLPCPFDRAMASNNVNFGIENRTSGTLGCAAASAPGYVRPPNIIIGGVPVRTLGLPDSYAGDAWGNKLTYAVSDMHVAGPAFTTTRNGSIQMQYGPNATVYNVNMQRFSYDYTATADAVPGTIFSGGALGGLAINDVVHIRSNNAALPPYNGSYRVSVAPTATSFTIGSLTFAGNDPGGTVTWQSGGTNTSYVVVSHGPDGRGAFTTAGGIVPNNRTCNNDPGLNSAPPPCTSNAALDCIDIKNCDADNIFVDSAYNDGALATQYFDDFIVWGSNDLLRSPANNRVYSGSVSVCPPNSCEPWCAACSKNFPNNGLGGSTTVPPLAFSNPAEAVLCKKALTSSATDCTASCFWSGPLTVPANGYQACP